MSDKTKVIYKIKIIDGQKHFEISGRKGENLLDVLRSNGILIPASCGGKGTCEKCKVHISEQGTVLACDYEIRNDLEILLPGFKEYAILDQLNPHARHVENNSGIIINRLENQRIVSYKDLIIFSGPDHKNRPWKSYGLAVDIGTTTVVLYLMDITCYDLVDVIPLLNPQTAFGADVISRIEYTMSNAKGLNTLQTKLIRQINNAIVKACQSADIEQSDIHLMTIVGNTIMLHILLGIDPRSIAFAPFTPVFTDERMLRAADLSIHINRKGIIRVLPSIAGYVGADIVAGVASTDLSDKENFILYVDIGTNGEIVLGNKEIIYCCSTAAGPAFEGARIQCGVGGVEGGISVYENGHYKTIGDQKPVGICGSGLIDLVAFLLETDRLDYTGLMTGEYLVEEKHRTAVDHDIVLTQKDIREVQLAKSAIYAGMLTLIGIAGITMDQVESVYLAGGFGNYIRISSAVRIGLLPGELEDRIIPVGNSAGTGALLALRSLDFEQETDKVKKMSQYIELSMRADFNEAYLSAMHFPLFD